MGRGIGGLGGGLGRGRGSRLGGGFGGGLGMGQGVPGTRQQQNQSLPGLVKRVLKKVSAA